MSNQRQSYPEDINVPGNSEGMFQESRPDPSGQVADMSQSDLVEAETAERSHRTGKSNTIEKSTIILMVACVLGVAGIYLFGTRSKAKEKSMLDQDMETKVDVALAKLQKNSNKANAKNLFKDSETMVNSFYDYSVKQQVALGELSRDPFTRAVEEKKPVVESEGVKQAKLRRMLSDKLVEIKLQSILQGPQGGKCMVNGEVYGQGQVIRNLFTVKVIENNQVVLEAKGMTFTLTM